MNVRTISFLLAAIFAVSGIAKLAALPFEVEAFARWGYAPAFMYATGVLEVAGAIGLLIRALSALASVCLLGLMLGAVATHAMHSELLMLAVALTIAALAAWRGWVGRGDITRLFSRTRI